MTGGITKPDLRAPTEIHDRIIPFYAIGAIFNARENNPLTLT